MYIKIKSIQQLHHELGKLISIEKERKSKKVIIYYYCDGCEGLSKYSTNLEEIDTYEDETECSFRTFADNYRYGSEHNYMSTEIAFFQECKVCNHFTRLLDLNLVDGIKIHDDDYIPF